jgi:hypothetical protein
VPFEITHGGAVRDHGNPVALAGIAEGIVGLIGNPHTGFGHAGAVGQAQVALGRHWLGDPDRQFSGGRKFVILQRGILQCVVLLLGH